MQDDPCTFYWQEELAKWTHAIGAASSGRGERPARCPALVAAIRLSHSSAAWIAREHAHEIFRRAVDIDGSRFARLFSWRGRPAEMHAPHVDHTCEEFLDRRQCFAVAQIPRWQQQARQARLDRVRRICTPPGRSINRRCSCRARCFRCAALLGGLDNQRRGCFDTRAETRMPGPATIERAPCRLHRTRQIERLASRWHGASRPGPSINFPVRWALGCGTGLIHCRGQTGRRFAAEMRYCTDSQGKTARAIG